MHPKTLSTSARSRNGSAPLAHARTAASTYAQTGSEGPTIASDSPPRNAGVFPGEEGALSRDEKARAALTIAHLAAHFAIWSHVCVVRILDRQGVRLRCSSCPCSNTRCSSMCFRHVLWRSCRSEDAKQIKSYYCICMELCGDLPAKRDVRWNKFVLKINQSAKVRTFNRESKL